MNQEDWNDIQKRQKIRNDLLHATKETFIFNAKYMSEHLAPHEFASFILNREILNIFQTAYELGIKHGLDPL